MNTKSAWLCTIVVLLSTATAFAQQSAESIIQHSVEANNRDWKAAPQYDYAETDRDKNGSKTYSVTMVDGSPYSRLVAINTKPLSSSQEHEEQQKFEKMLGERKSESPEQRSKRIAKYEADRKRDGEMLDQLTKAFNFTLAGRGRLDGHAVYVLNAAPRPGYQPPNRDTQVLPGMRGRLWIDQKTFQWVKVEAEVVHPVSIEGFLATVEPGTRFELEKTPVSNDIWLPKHFAMRASAKVLHVFSHREQEDDSYSNYHKASAPAPEKEAGAN
jgi:hypothetical protein